jgi:hypothetical protein
MGTLYLRLHCYLCGFEMLVMQHHKPLCPSCSKQKMVVIGHVYKKD